LATDRSNCSKCKALSNTHLTDNTCVCDTNYIDVTVPISTAALGLWNNLTPSLSSCKLNCSAVLTGCQQNDCLNSSFCTICSTNYVLVAVSLVQQTCVRCSVRIPHCALCFDSNTCATCAIGYALDSVSNPGVVSCKECRQTINNCTTCSSLTVCTDCDIFYGLNGNNCKICNQLIMPGC